MRQLMNTGIERYVLQHEVFGKWEKNAFSTVLPLASFDGHTETKLY